MSSGTFSDERIRRIVNEELNRNNATQDLKSTINSLLNSLFWRDHIMQQVQKEASAHVPTAVSQSLNTQVPSLVESQCRVKLPTLLKEVLLNDVHYNSTLLKLNQDFENAQKKGLEKLIKNPALVIGSTFREEVKTEMKQDLQELKKRQENFETNTFRFGLLLAISTGFSLISRL
jgi:hypothetical protein